MGKFLGKLFKSKSKSKTLPEITINEPCITFGPSQESESISDDESFIPEKEVPLKPVGEEPPDIDLEAKIIEEAFKDLEDPEELQLENSYYQQRSTNKNAIGPLKVKRIIPFRNQDINEIRKRNKEFTDNLFPPGCGIIIKNLQSKFFKDICQYLHVQNTYSIDELNSKIAWKRPHVK